MYVNNRPQVFIGTDLFVCPQLYLCIAAYSQRSSYCNGAKDVFGNFQCFLSAYREVIGMRLFVPRYNLMRRKRNQRNVIISCERYI